MKKITAIILIAALILCMVGCASNSETSNYGLLEGTKIVVDEETGVNYMYHWRAEGGGLSPRYNADGSLYVSEVE